jgi:hypothetical protein
MMAVIQEMAVLIAQLFAAKGPMSVDLVHADHHLVSFSVKTVNHPS